MTEPHRRAHAMPFGAALQPGGGVRFRLWAPAEDRVGLILDDRPEPIAMTRVTGGWHEASVVEAGPGARYAFAIGGGPRVPDPASRTTQVS